MNATVATLKTQLINMVNYINTNGNIIVNPNGKWLELDVYNKLLAKRRSTLIAMFNDMVKPMEQHSVITNYNYNDSYSVSISVVEGNINAILRYIRDNDIDDINDIKLAQYMVDLYISIIQQPL